MVSFHRSCFRLFSRKFSNKLVQALSCERPKTALRTLFQLFANNKYFQITVLYRSFLKKSVKLVCHVGNSNIAIGSLLTLQITLVIVALPYLKRFILSSNSYRLLKYRGGCTIPLFQLSVQWARKVYAAAAEK